MRTAIIIIMILLLTCLLPAQSADRLEGRVLEKNVEGKIIPVAGANVFVVGTANGTSTNADGSFTLLKISTPVKLAISSVGYKPDTIAISVNTFITVELSAEAHELSEVVVEGVNASSTYEYKSAGFVQTMSQKELFKAACCNLSESFETNPSIDVSFTDAITGLKQIEMLGLAGIYSLITVENMPSIRGLSSSIGLSYIPGTWIKSIQVSKGTGSVANGYESITGQINVELHKPEDKDEDNIFFNFFGNSEKRFEGNLNFRKNLGEGIDALTLLHGSFLKSRMDGNSDRFLDMPLGNTINFLQRFHIAYPRRFENQIGVQYVSDSKSGGTLNGYEKNTDELSLLPKEYSFRMKNVYLRIFGKNGYVFEGNSYSSVALQWSFSNFKQNNDFNLRRYDGEQSSGYFNFIFQSSFDSTIHQYRLGLSFQFDNFKEKFPGLHFERTERIPGIFGEYTYNPADELSLIAGVRTDFNDLFGTITSPRLHLRYTPHEDWVLRLVAGKGVRTANVLSENLAFFASARNLNFPVESGNYPFKQESAWNIGFNLTHYFLFEWREGTITLDLYRTVFDKQVVIDLDRDPQSVYFYNLNGKSYSNTIQAEINFQPVERLDARIAYRYVDTKQSVNNKLVERPFISKNRMLLNLGYSSERDEPDQPQMLYDLTIQWFGPKRLPDTELNPADFRSLKYSPSFALVNSQITRSFNNRFDLYLGIENIFGFKQNSPIIDPENPDGKYFDSSIIWGPIYGRMVYAGLRWRV
ncbi:MAG: TonB-dependent receptor [Ignavibacteriales bacterium]|nr:TonB-dependent receptor [Ignavibacteriales bacterium]